MKRRAGARSAKRRTKPAKPPSRPKTFPRERPAPTPERTVVTSTPPSTIETALLTLARTLSAAARSQREPRAAVGTALAVLASAFQAGAPLPRALVEARRAAARDEADALATAWAREQLRLSLAEILAAADGASTVGLPTDSLAWLVLAGCEALADEPPDAAADRVRVLLGWLTEPRGA
jgi:hypothetical protein